MNKCDRNRCGLAGPPERLSMIKIVLWRYQDMESGKIYELWLTDPYFDEKTKEELRKLEPFGEGNAEPVFLLKEVRVVEASKMGAEGEHLRLVVWDQHGKSMKLVRFRAPEEYLKLRGGETVNVWAQLVENEFRGIRSAEGRILKLAVL